MKFRRIPRPTGAVREIPDLIRLRFFRTNWGSERYIIEALRGDRCLGDRAFATRADALAFGRMCAQWDGAQFVDESGG